MQADLTRDTFDPREHFTRVLMQQGRVQLDSDWNEQVAILLHYMQTLAADLIGPHGGPGTNSGFEITLETDDSGKTTDLGIGSGRYYVDGILCENDRVDGEGKEVKVTFRMQPDYPLLEGEQLPTDPPFLVYLDVWERHITAIENPEIREVALGGPDTATRARVVWQVKTTDEMPEKFDPQKACGSVQDNWNQWVEKQQPANRGKLKAKAREESDTDTNPCTISPEARYRRTENQLYRVEIHKGGRASTATFKWSRDNGSVAFPIRHINSEIVTLEYLGRDSRLSLRIGDCVEIEDDHYVLRAEEKPVLQVEDIDFFNMQVTLNKPPVVSQNPSKHLLLRRWDHGGNNSNKALLEQDSCTHALVEDKWLELEDGVLIYFDRATFPYTTKENDTLASISQAYDVSVDDLLERNPEITSRTTIFEAGVRLTVPGGAGDSKDVYHRYRTGDYWLIPARTVTGDVEWPKDDRSHPEVRPPHGVEHHYAPLAVILSGGDDKKDTPVDCRCKFSLTRVCG